MAIRRGVLEGSSGSHRVRREIQMGLEVKKRAQEDPMKDSGEPR